MRPLFGTPELRKVLERRQADLIREIDEIPPETLLEADPEKLAEALVDSFSFTPVVLDETNISIDKADQRVDVSQDGERYIRDRSRPVMMDATIVTFFVPFDGDAELFKFRPSSHSLNPPSGLVKGRELALQYVTTDGNAGPVRAKFDRNLANIRKYLGWTAGDVGDALPQLRSAAKDRIAERRRKLLADHELVSELGFPVRRRDGNPDTYVVPEIRRKAAISSGDGAPAKKAVPLDPTLSMEEYEHILSVVTNMVAVMERSPRAFAGMHEEDLRQHFLVQLNGQYEGNATGETFNFEGKTDILIRHKGKNLFIAECKFWEGPKALAGTIDQLLGYTSWRDTRTAILLFNRTKDLTKVVEQVPNAVEGHPNYIRTLEYSPETGNRFVLHHRDDKDRELVLTVLVFEVPQ